MALREHFLALFGVAVALGLFSAARFYTVSWLGERVTADLRNAVYAHVLRQSPAYFETTQTGEVLSRLTADTTLVQTVVGSSLSMGLRNAVMGVGALAMLIFTNPYVMTQVLAILVLVVLPSMWFGRRVRTPVARQPGPRRRLERDRGGGAQCHPGRAKLHRRGTRGSAFRRFDRRRLSHGGAAQQGAFGAGGLHHHRHLGGAAVGPVPGHAGGAARRHQRRTPGPDRGVRPDPGQRDGGARRGLWRPAPRRRRDRTADGTAARATDHRFGVECGRSARPVCGERY